MTDSTIVITKEQLRQIARYEITFEEIGILRSCHCRDQTSKYDG